MLHKGDLVKIKKTQTDKSECVETAVVLCDPYATIMSEYTGDGNALYSCEKIVVDLLCGNTLLSKIPTDTLQRCNK